jgi:hypothetical protein
LTFLIAISANLLSAAVGAGLAFGYERWLRVRRARVARWFWNRGGTSEVQIFLGTRSALLGNEPNERFLTVSDAEVLGRLSSVFEEFFDSIEVIHDASDIDWAKPVVSIGGGNSNRIFQNIDISDYPEFRFDSADHYTIVNRDGSQRSTSVEPHPGEMSSSYAIVGRFGVRSGEVKSDLIVIAGAFGPSTLRALVHVLEKRNLREIFDAVGDSTSFQTLLRVVHHDDGHFTTELSSLTELESLQRRIILAAEPRDDVPEATAAAARAGDESPQSNS